MRLTVSFALIVGLVGCGSTIGTLDSLPSGPDLSDAAWPLLLDTPAPPEEQLTAGTGGRALENLGRAKSEANARLLRADAVEAVSDSLGSRGIANQSRSADIASPEVDDVALLARAVRVREQTEVVTSNVDESGLLARASRQREQSVIGARSVDETDLLARAARQRDRTAKIAGSVDEAALRARAGLTQSNAEVAAPAPTTPQAAPSTPRAPAPLRSLDAPVVSSSFEERARLARLRASKASN